MPIFRQVILKLMVFIGTRAISTNNGAFVPLGDPFPTLLGTLGNTPPHSNPHTHQ